MPIQVVTGVPNEAGQGSEGPTIASLIDSLLQFSLETRADPFEIQAEHLAHLAEAVRAVLGPELYPDLTALRPLVPEMSERVEAAISDLVFVARATGATNTSWLLFQAKPADFAPAFTPTF
jgi:hypothetical protein